jgi:hypothetical protein
MITNVKAAKMLSVTLESSSRIVTAAPLSGCDRQHSTFARFSEFLDFRLFQQYRPQPDVARPKAGTVVSSVKRDGTVQ